MFQPTLPEGTPDSAEFIISLVNASLEAIHHLNNSAYHECWVCFSHTHPLFYEGVAMSLMPRFTNNSSDPLTTQSPEGSLTLGSISGVGFCLLGPHMLPPSALIEVCNQTLVINTSYSYTIAFNGTYFACASGLTSHIYNSAFLETKDYCVIVTILPLIFHS